MRLTNLLILTLMFVLSNIEAQASDGLITRWQGTYEYQGYGGRTAGGSPITLDITFSLSKSGDCKITREGFQRNDELICSVSSKLNGIDVLFKSYPGGKIENEYGVAVYKIGEILFSIFPKNKGGALITDWGRLKPSFEKKKRGIFFKCVKQGSSS